ncbi:MAG: hypothetical protein ACYCOX_03855 [Acidobacteriaceae bacterium]
MAIRLYINAVFKHWWALMSCALFTFLGVYILHANKSNHWAVKATFASAGFCLLVACFLAWNDEHRAFLKEKEKNSKPIFEGYFWRIIMGLSDSEVMTVDQYTQALKVLQKGNLKRAVTANIDILTELFIENISPGLAQVIHIELSIILGDTRITLESTDELDKYALAKTTWKQSPLLSHIDVQDAPKESLPDLRMSLMGSTPLAYRNKAEGWLLFRAHDINPNDIQAGKGQFELTLYDSNRDSHTIRKSIGVTRPGIPIRNPNWKQRS